MTTVEAQAPTEVRREQNRWLFSAAELVILVIALAGLAAGIVALATGAATS